MPEKLAFGVEPNSRRYNLRLARYPGMADAVRVFREEKAARGARDEPLALLDVGAAAGRTLQYLKSAGLDAGITFSGIDYTPIDSERLFEADRWDYRVGDVEQGLPYDDGSFDIVICEQVLEHLHKADFVMSEIDRVLKPGGMAVLGVPTFPPGFAAIRQYIVPRIDKVTGRKRGHVQVFTRNSFVRRIERATTLKVDQVQAFRLASGGILTPLENIHGWYRFSRRTATALSSLAIEVQAIAYKPTERGEVPPTDASRRRRLFGSADNWR